MQVVAGVEGMLETGVACARRRGVIMTVIVTVTQGQGPEHSFHRPKTPSAAVPVSCCLWWWVVRERLVVSRSDSSSDDV